MAFTGALGAGRADIGYALYDYMGKKGEFIATRVLAPLNVRKKEGNAAAVAAAALTEDINIAHAAGAEFANSSTGLSDVPYSCQDYGYEKRIPLDQLSDVSNEFEPRMASARVGGRVVLHQREKRVKAALFNETAFAGHFTDLSATAPFAAAGSDIIGAISIAQDQVENDCGAACRTLLLGKTALDLMLLNTAFLAQIASNGVVGKKEKIQALADVLDMDEIIVGKTGYWGDVHALVCVRGEDGILGGGVGNFIRWMDFSYDIDGDADDASRTVQVYEYPDERTDSIHLRVREYTDELVFPQFGRLLRIKA